MPAVLQESQFASWLDPSVKDVDALGAMVDAAQVEFHHHAVGTRLNAAKNDDEKLLEPV